MWYKTKVASCVDKAKETATLPMYSLAEISKHKNKESKIWITYKEGVYDITEFVDLHPGGPEKILLGAGGSIDPYWEVFANHNTREVKEMLEVYRIGNIKTEDRAKALRPVNPESHYSGDPIRSPILNVKSSQPFNAETPILLLDNNYITPNSLFFVRNHLPVPKVDPDTYVLEVKGDGLETLKLNLKDLKKNFKQHVVTSTIQCAGNRRNDLSAVKDVKGLPWSGGAIGTAEWTGVKLKDVLAKAGVKDSDDNAIKHIHLLGLDTNPLTKECYGTSIPVEKAIDTRGDCLLAYKMNGEDLPRDNGFPLRAIIPGTVGARNVKWLSKIVASDVEYDGQWQQRDYKGFSPSVDWNNVNFSSSPAIQELPVQSLICTPQNGMTVKSENDEVLVSGIAWSGGGRAIIRVDVSIDKGEKWSTATLMRGTEQNAKRAWAWTFWEVYIPLPENKSEINICCKAVDESYNVQPDTPAPIWNLRGCLSNAWHYIKVFIK